MDSENPNSADIAPEMPVTGPGARLRAARDAMRVDLPHIAAETRIPLRHLQSIEDNQFEDLPSRAYAIGFSRSFAKAVGLDPAEITDLVRAELSDGSMRRTTPTSSMEPGDPARLPSLGLTWAAAAAVLILAIGAFAFYRTYFGAGAEPGLPLASEPAATVAAPVEAAPSPAIALAASGPVVLTATQDGIWVRLFEDGGERLAERTLARGESIEVPTTARDPRINTGRPDALTVTIGGQPVAPLSDRPQTVSGAQVSAAALLARATTPAAAAAPTPLAGETVPARRPNRPPATTRPLSAPAAEPGTAASAPSSVSETATTPG